MDVVERMLGEGVVLGDCRDVLPLLPEGSVDLFLTSPPYADARGYSRIRPEDYVGWFMPIADLLRARTASTGWLVLNIKERVAQSPARLRGQRHPYVYELVLEMQRSGWRWVEEYVWHRTNSMPGRFGPRCKDSFERVYAFAAGDRPHFDLDVVRVPYMTSDEEIDSRRRRGQSRENTDAGFGRDRSSTYSKGGADPGNVVSLSQSYNQHDGVGGRHPALMPEGLASFFVGACCPPGGLVVDPFAGAGTTVRAARDLGRRSFGIELHEEYVGLARSLL